MTVVLAKEEPGQFFPDLDMLTKLLVRKGDLSEKSKADQIKRPLIEVVSKGDTLEGTQLEKGTCIMNFFCNQCDWLVSVVTTLTYRVPAVSSCR